MAIEQRRPTQVVHHSDHGTQYTSIAFGQRCRELGVRPSMGSVGIGADHLDPGSRGRDETDAPAQAAAIEAVRRLLMAWLAASF